MSSKDPGDNESSLLFVGAGALAMLGLVGYGLYRAAQPDAEIARTPMLGAVSSPYFYHETQGEHLDDIRREGLRPMSYGQSFVKDDGSVQTPEDALEDIKWELEDESEDLDAADEDIESRAREILEERHPIEDFTPRTYVLEDEPFRSRYGDVLLRFPRSIAGRVERDVDPYILKEIPVHELDVRTPNGWQKLNAVRF